MRIAVFHNLSSGGAKRTLHNTVQRLSTKHQMDVYTLSCANHVFGDVRPYVTRYEIFPFQPGPSLRSPFGRLNQVIRLADLIRLRSVYRRMAESIDQGHYDLVYVQPCQFENAPSLLRFLGRTPSVFYCHEALRILYESWPVRPYDRRDSKRRQILNRFDPLPAMYYQFLKRTDQQNLHSASRVLVNSVFTQESVRRIYGVDAKVSYHGIDETFFHPSGASKRRVLLSVGSLTPLKGFDFLIQAISYIPKDARPPLVIASNFHNPLERDYLEELARRLDVDLRLVGNVTDDYLVELYNQAEITVYAPIREPFGLVPLESLACSTPVVAVREGGTQETIVDGRTGLLVEREPGRFAEAVASLLANPGLARNYGLKGRECVLGNWTWDRAVKSLEDHWASCATIHS